MYMRKRMKMMKIALLLKECNVKNVNVIEENEMIYIKACRS